MLAALFFEYAVVAQAPAVPSLPELPEVHARLATGPIKIDGKLNEPAWQQAEVMHLTQQAPHPGQSSPYLTEVRVLIWKDALIFGIVCHDPNPKAIAVHSLTRDGDQSGDDTVTLLLDTFGDKRTGYLFQINADAARVDGLIASQLNYSADWDGLWDARSVRTSDGWTAEVWIPAQTLSFAGSKNHWGLQIDRSVVRDQTDLRWASPYLDANLFDMARAGDLEIDTPLKQGHGVEITPYTSGRELRNFNLPAANWLATGGGELTWRVTPQLAAILSVNTDFAETEVDSRQINVTPFPLYFPEKRAFFLEGANQFVYGLDLDTTYTFIPFFSRNIGLLDGYDLPLDGGIKLNGHVGPWSLALLDVKSRTTFVPSSVVSALGLSSPKVEGTNLLATRVAYDFPKQFRVGAIVTHGDPEAKLSNTLVGADANWQTATFLKKRNLQVGGWAATTQGQVPNGNRQAWGIRADYPNDLIYCTAGTERFGEGFEPLLGFLPRPASHQTDAFCSYRPRPSANNRLLRPIRQEFYDFGYSRITDTNGKVQSQTLQFDPLRLGFNSGASLMVSALIDHEYLPTPFSVVPTVTYPVGGYDFQRYSLTFATSPKRSIQFSNSTTVGGYYNGHLTNQSNTIYWTPFHGKVEAQVTANDYFAHTPQGNFVEKLWQFKGGYSFSPDLAVSTFVQYDNVSFDLTSNTRLRWTFKPGDDFFVIWDRTWVRNATRPGLNLDPDAESITAKIRWTFRL